MTARNTVTVRVSVASARQRFHGCDPAYIAAVCHGRCCDAPTRPTGTLIAIHRSETAAIEARGGSVAGGLLVTPERRCTFKTDESLCSLHDTGAKPFGCIASPFTLNASDCLIVRNRYRMLPCYEDARRAVPAYEAFRPSLDLLFGVPVASALVFVLAHTEERFVDAPMRASAYAILRDLDATRKA